MSTPIKTAMDHFMATVETAVQGLRREIEEGWTREEVHEEQMRQLEANDAEFKKSKRGR